MIKNILKIAKFEFKRSKITYDKKVLAILIPSLIIILLFFFLFLKSGDFFENKFYTVYSETSGLEVVYDLSGKFVEVDDTLVDVYTNIGKKIYVYKNRDLASSAATESLIKSIRDYNQIIFSSVKGEERFPVWIKTEMVRQLNESNFNELTFDKIDENKERVEEIQKESVFDTSVEKEVVNSGVIDDVVSDTSVKSVTTGSKSNEKIVLDEVVKEERKIFDTFDKTDLKTPSQLSPALPFEPIYTALTIIVILTFVTLLYSNRIYDEKVNKKGSLLLIAPTSTFEIIVGKTLPHVGIGLILAMVISLFKTTNIMSLVLLFVLFLAIILVYLSIAFLIAILARSFKELSFIGIFGISMYSLFLLIPTFMISFSEASLASPLTVVVKLLLNESVGFNLYLFALIPQILMAVLLFYIGGLIFTGEDLFSYKNIVSKILDTFENFLKKPYYLIFSSAAMIPFVFIIELLLIVVLISVKTSYILPLILLVSAFTEEIFKSLALYTIYSRKLFNVNSSKKSVILGVFTGLGFFLGEKLILVIMITSFIKEYALIIFAGLLIPLVLHVVLSVIFSFGMYKLGRRWMFILVVVCSLLHFGANMFLSGGFI